MAGRGRKLLENLQKAKEKEQKDQAASDAAAKAAEAPPVAQASVGVPPAGRGRGKIIQSLVAATRETSPPRESSSGSSSDQPSPSGAVGSPPTEELERLVVEEIVPRRVFPTGPAEIRNKQRGTDGQTIPLALNFIKLTRKEGLGIFLYDIKFSPVVDSRPLRAKILRQNDVISRIGTVFQFTGMNIYLPTQFEGMTIDTTTPVDGSPIRLTIEFIKVPHFDELIPFYNTAFRKIMRELKLVQIQRHYFDPTARIEVPQHKLEIWPGWATSIQELDDGLLLTCDASHRLLRTSTAKEIMQELFKLPDGKVNFKDNVKKRLLGTIVLTRYNNKPYRVDDIDFANNPMSTFNWNGTDVTYVDYFKKSWALDIKDLRQPLLVNRPKPKRGQVGYSSVVVPLILCYFLLRWSRI